MIDSRTKIFNNINKDLSTVANFHKDTYFTPLLSYRSGKFGKHQSDGIGKCCGLYYKYNAERNYLEFTHGHADADLSNFSTKNPCVKSAKVIKFDSKVDVSHVKDMFNMFYNDKNLNNIIFSNNFDTSNVTDMSYMFARDENLNKLNLPNSFNTSNVISMSSIFENDKNLKKLSLPNSFKVNNVKRMDNMFSSDDNLRKLILPKTFDTSNVESMFGMFSFTPSLRELYLPESFNTIHVHDISWMFADCGLRHLTLPKHFSTVNIGTPNQYEAMFDRCNLNSITTTSPNNLNFPFEPQNLEFNLTTCTPPWFKEAYKSIGNGYTSMQSTNILKTHATGTFYRGYHIHFNWHNIKALLRI